LRKGLNGWQPSPELVVELRRRRPDLTDQDITDSTTEWRDLANREGAPRKPARAWLAFMVKSPKREQPSFVI
jgi:hypothetical protein